MAILRSEHENHLMDIGVSGVALDILMKECAEVRHKSRVEDAEHAALFGVMKLTDREYYEDTRSILDKLIDPDQPIYDGMLAQAAGFCLMEEIGVGGHDNVSGDSTVRMPFFRGLGSGRKHAPDGGAWDAAIVGAERNLAEKVGYTGRVITVCPITPENTLWGKLADGDPKWSDNEGGVGVVLPMHENWADGRSDFIPIPVPYGDYSWHWSLARECLRRVCGMRPWHTDVYFDVMGSPEEWTKVVNELEMRMRDEENA